MDKFSIRFRDLLHESLDDQFKDKLDEKYKSLKRGTLALLEETIDDTEKLVNVQNFIDSYIKDPEKNTLVGFVDDAEIYNFYLKFQGNIDEICSDYEYFDESPSENNIFSLYNFIVHGTKFAVYKIMNILSDELFTAEK